jgi:hypothetical protein
MTGNFVLNCEAPKTIFVILTFFLKCLTSAGATSVQEHITMAASLSQEQDEVLACFFVSECETLCKNCHWDSLTLS